MAKKPPKNVKIKPSNNNAAAVETKQPDNFVALQYIDALMQKAPGTRAEHIAAQRSIQQVGQALQQGKGYLEIQHRLVKATAESKKKTATIEKLQKQIDKLKGKIK